MMGRNRDLLDRAVERYQKRDLDGYMDLYTEDAVLTAPDGTYEGRAAIHERLSRELAGFPDCEFIVGDFVEQGDWFADEWTFVGTHTAAFRLPDGTELPATGKRVKIRGMEMVRVRDGKMVVDNLYFDVMESLVQLGLVPQPVTA